MATVAILSPTVPIWVFICPLRGGRQSVIMESWDKMAQRTAAKPNERNILA